MSTHVNPAAKTGKPYVYLLCYPDGTVFYIGKGRHARPRQHILEAKHGGCEKKHEIIRSLLAQEVPIRVKIESIHETDQQAWQREQELILEYKNDPSKGAYLTNKVVNISPQSGSYLAKNIKSIALPDVLYLPILAMAKRRKISFNAMFLQVLEKGVELLNILSP